MYHVSAQGVDEHMINVHYYYCGHFVLLPTTYLSIYIYLFKNYYYDFFFWGGITFSISMYIMCVFACSAL